MAEIVFVFLIVYLTGSSSFFSALILCGFAGLFGRNVVVFLRKLKWISYRGSGDGVTPCEFNRWFIMGFAGEFVHFGKTHTFWQKGYSVAKASIVYYTVGKWKVAGTLLIL